tara:strand:+ start:79 stop:453 length:375 start_codon:yes stop_codon:yes gene_type:complete
MKDLIRINFDDYYKFIVSLGIVVIIILLITALYFNYLGVFILNLGGTIFLLTVLGILSGIIVEGVIPWRKRQKIHDKILDLEYRTLDANLKKLKLSRDNEELSQEKSNLILKKFDGVNISGTEK